MTALVAASPRTISAFARIAAIAAIGTVCGVETGRAEDASAWVHDSYSALRLLAGSPGGKGLIGGVEIRMKPGWKTYWRTPGDSGIPPRFDFTKSENVESVTVLWPAPMKFSDGAGGYSIGYAEKVVLPLRVVPKNSEHPVTLRATIDYAVCEKLCVPVQAHAEIAFAKTPNTTHVQLAAALQSVPQPARIGEGDFAIRAIRREGAKRVIIDAAVPQSGSADLFVEGPTPDWALPIPVPADGPGPGLRRFTVDLDGVPAGAKLAGSKLKFTLVGKDRAYEYDVTLP